MTALWLAAQLAVATPPADATAPPIDDPATVSAAPVVSPADIEGLRAEIAGLRAEVQALREVRADGFGPPPIMFRPPRPPAPHVAHIHRAFGGDVVVPAGTTVREATSYGGDLEVWGLVQRDVRSFGGDIIVHGGGEVAGNAESFGGDIIIEPGGALRGRANTLGGELIVMPGGATGSVALAPEELGVADTATEAASWVWDTVTGFYRWLVFLLAFAGAGVLIVALFPDRVAKVAAHLEEYPGRAGLSGLGWTIGLTVLSVLFVWTLVGPVVLLGALGLAWMLGFVGLCQMLGDRLPFSYKPHGRWLAFLVGSLVVSLLGALPWVGTLTVILASLFGIGAAFGSRFGSR